MDINLKIKIIKEILYNSEKVYMHLQPHSELIIGKRGLIANEVTKGIVLVFGPTSYKNLQFEEKYIFVDMSFSKRWEHVIIPIDAISAIFDSLDNPSYVLSFTIKRDIEDKTTKDVKKEGDDQKVIKVNFKKEK